jgi:glutathione S-transferase
MKNYDFTLAPNPRRLRISVVEKGLKIPYHQLVINAGEARTSEFLAKNPAGGLPALELDDGSHLAESVAICRYLEGLHPEPNLMGRAIASRHSVVDGG